MPRISTLFENTKKPTTLSSNMITGKFGTGSKHNIVSPPENKDLYSIISSSIYEGLKNKAPVHRYSVKKTYGGNSSILQNNDNTDHSESQNHSLKTSVSNEVSSLISDSIVSNKSVQASINDSSLIFTKPLPSLKFPTSVECPTSLTKPKNAIELTHLYDQLNSKRTPNFTRAGPSGFSVTDTRSIAACDGGFDIVARIQRIADKSFSDLSALKATMKEDCSSKTTSESKNNAVSLLNGDYPSLTNELVLDSKGGHVLQANGAPYFPFSYFITTTNTTNTTNTTTSKIHENSTTSDKLYSTRKADNNVTNSNNDSSSSKSTTTGYTSFNFDNPKLRSPASLHVLTEKMNITPCVQFKEAENNYEDDDDDNNSMYSYFEITQLIQEDDDYNDQEEEEEEENEVKTYEVPEDITPERAYSELKTGCLNVLDTLANIDKIINDLMDSIHRNKSRIITVGLKFEDIAKEEGEQDANISPERTEELKLKKEEYWKRLGEYQKIHNKMNKQAMIHMTRATKNMVALVSVERALACMEREFIDVKKKKKGIFKRIRNLFGFGRKD